MSQRRRLIPAYASWRRYFLQQQENERHNEQDGDGEHAERSVAGQGRGGGHQEGADD